MAKIRKDDIVLVIAGKDRGMRGRVRQVWPRENRVVVEGVNVAKHHLKPRGMARQAGIVEMEAPLDISNVMLVCDKCDSPTRVGMRYLDDGRKVRYCKSCGEPIGL